MELSLILAKQVLSMGMMILLGIVLMRKKILPADANSVLATLVLYVIQPCIIINAYRIEYSPERLKGLLLCAAAAAAVHVFFILLAKVGGRFFGLSRAERASLIYTNCGNLIIPLVSAILGDEYVFYLSAFVSVFNIFFWTHGIGLIGADSKDRWKKILMNPNLIAIAVSLIIFLTPISLPEIISKTISSMAVCVGPISMIGIGVLMGGFNMKKVLTDARAYTVTILRLIVMPLLLILLLGASGIVRASSQLQMILLTTILAAAAPTAVSVPQFAQVSGSSEEDIVAVGRANVMTTAFCMITLPVMVYLYQVICY